jgi:NAD-dependent SIR2 family protein deacetylase
MERSKCPKCEGIYFETVLEEPENSNFKIQFVRCKSCKTVVGVL